MDVLSLNQQFVRELLDLYRQLPAVWKVKSVEYKNKMAKNHAYDLLVQKCREFVPDADKEFVKHKINSLRTSFRKERRKVRLSKASVLDISEIYVPKLWYYNLLLFIVDEQEEEEGTFVEHENFDVEDTRYCDFKSEPSSPASLPKETDPLLTIETVAPSKKPRLQPPPTPYDDVYDAIGKNVAHKLRGMTQQQKIIAEKIISDVMYHGQMETLTLNSHLVLDKDR